MRPWLTRVAVLVTLILPQLTNNAIAQGGPPPRSVEAYRVVEHLVQHRQELALDSHQVTRLTELAQRLRATPGRLRITGQRVPGKSSPRVERRPMSRREALRDALRVLRPEQRATATRLIGSDSTKMVHQ
jgi:hypothetical protein